MDVNRVNVDISKCFLDKCDQCQGIYWQPSYVLK